MIEEIESFRAKLQRHFLSQPRILNHGKVHVVKAGPYDHVAAQVSESGYRIVSSAEIKVVSQLIAVERTTLTDDVGRYQIAALPVGARMSPVRSRLLEAWIAGLIRARSQQAAHPEPHLAA